MSDEVAVQEPVEQQTEEQEVVAQESESQEPESTEEKTEPEAKDPIKKENHDDRRWRRLLQERSEFKAKAELLEQLYQQKQAPAAQNAEGVPNRADYPDDESYVRDLVQFQLKGALTGVQDKITQTQTHAQVQQTWATKVTEARSTYADYDSVMEDAQDIPINQHVAEAIQTSDVGADVAYYLGKHPEEAERINGLPPLAAARAIGRIESRIEDVRSKQTKTSASKAPDPIKPVKPTGSGGKKNPEEMSMEEYYAHRLKQRNNKRG
jgi:hypothetical protein